MRVIHVSVMIQVSQKTARQVCTVLFCLNFKLKELNKNLCQVAPSTAIPTFGTSLTPSPVNGVAVHVVSFEKMEKLKKCLKSIVKLTCLTTVKGSDDADIFSVLEPTTVKIMRCARVQDKHMTTGRINQAGVILC